MVCVSAERRRRVLELTTLNEHRYVFNMPRAQLTSNELDSMRERLATTALDIYRREGLDAVSFRRIAEAAGISHTLPYRYFENKDALLARLRTDAVHRFEAYVRQREAGYARPLERIRAVTLAYVDYVRRWPADYLLIFATHQPPPDQFRELLAARRSLFEHAVEAVQQSLDQGVVQLSKGTTARQLTHTVWVSLHGLMTLHVANQLVHGCELEELVQPLIDRLLGTAAAIPSPRGRAASAPRRALKPAAPKRKTG